MRNTKTLAVACLLPATVALSGCEDIAGILNQPPPTLVERDGLSYQVMVSASPYYYDVFEYRIRVTNTSYRTIDRYLPSDLAAPRVYRDGHWGRPVWDPCRWGCDAWGRHAEYRVRLRSGEALEGWWGEVYAADFAGRSHGGVYHLALRIDTGRHRFEVLGLPEIWVR